MNFTALFFRHRRLFRIAGAASALLLLLLAVGAAVVWHAVPDPLAQVRRWPVSPVLLDRQGTLIHARLSADEEWCLPIPLSEMGDWLPKVLVAVEDKRFYRHSGVDLLALGRASFQNLLAGRIVSGASTISSQLVRLSTPRPRTFSAKLLEFVGAWKLERSLSKDAILEYYLNRAPFGGPIRGAEAAARLYFGKRAKELSLGEAALLVGLLKGPTAYRPDRNPRAALRRRQQIITQVAAQTGFPPDLTALALQEPLPVFRPAMPTAAWHFADLALATLPPSGGVARSTLDMRLQGLLERSLRERLRPLDPHVTAAGILVENRTGEIRAYVGNARFTPTIQRHWVDCALAPRSPGSTLKPFIYLEAIQEGLIIPDTLLADTPLYLGGEAPRNFDRQYRGPVSARAALASSLNTPAVRVQRMIGLRTALSRLREAGFARLDRSDDVYGDSLVLGAGEVTLLELARAYTALASLGLDRPLLLRRAPVAADTTGSAKGKTPSAAVLPLSAVSRPSSAGNSAPKAAVMALSAGSIPRPESEELFFLRPLPAGLADMGRQLRAAKSGELPPARQLYSAAAAFLIADILKDPGRLPFLQQLVQARDNMPVAFKTGTSFGLRDAWTVAYTPAYTLAIWFGREDGRADDSLLGISLATPAAMTVMRALADGGAKAWYSPPTDDPEMPLGRTRVCALSGAAPSPYCPSTREVWYIPAVWRTVPCSMHTWRDGRRVLVWPPELEDFNRKRFAAEDLSRSVFIVSPMPGARYMLTPGASRQPIALKADGVTYPVHWYVDGAYLGEQTRADLPLYWQPAGGDHEISLLDARERVGSASVPVTDLGAVRKEELPLLGE